MQNEFTVWGLIVEEIKYLGTTLTNQNFIAKEIKSRLRSGNACYHSVQHIWSSRLLSKNLKINIIRNTILPVVLDGCETWSLTLREERKMRIFFSILLPCNVITIFIKTN